jgi:hypothetical protein
MYVCLMVQFIDQIARNSSTKTWFAVDDPSRDWETRFKWGENRETCVCRRQVAIAKRIGSVKQVIVQYMFGKTIFCGGEVSRSARCLCGTISRVKCVTQPITNDDCARVH